MFTSSKKPFFGLLSLTLLLGLVALPSTGCDLFTRPGEDDPNGGNGGNGNGENGNGVEEITIYDVRDPALRAQLVSLENLYLEDLVVTAVRQYTFNEEPRYDIFVQHVDGGPYSAIQVWSLGAAPEPGDVISVQGDYDSYFGMDQIRGATYEVTGTASIPEPAVFADPAELATGGAASYAWQSGLVEIENVSVTLPEFLGSDGRWHGDFQVDGDLVVGRLFSHGYGRPRLEDEFLSLTGVLTYSYDESRLQPRFNEDIVFIDGTNPGPRDPSAVTIRQVRDPALRAQLPDTPFTVEGIVTASRARSTYFDFFIQSPDAGLHDGIMVFGANMQPSPGDVVQVTGTYQQYFGMDQLTYPTVTIVEAGGPVPEPMVVSASTIATGSVDAFGYQSLLLTVEGGAVIQAQVLGNDGTWRGDFLVTGDLVVGRLFGHQYEAVLGDEFQSITGVLRLYFEEYRLEPRKNLDIVFADGTSPGPGDPGDPTAVTIGDVRDPALRALLPDAPFTVEGIVTASRARGSYFDFFIQSENAGIYDGIYIYGANMQPSPGDVVQVTGTYQQFYGMDQLTYPTVTIVEAGGPVPVPMVVSAATIATGSADAFGYQSLLLTVEGGAVIQAQVLGTDGTWRGDFLVTGDLVVGRLFGHLYDAVLGDEFQSITGVLRLSFDQYRLEPRSNADIVFADGTSPSAG